SGGALRVRPVERSDRFQLLHLLSLSDPVPPVRSCEIAPEKQKGHRFSDGPVALVLWFPSWKPPESRAFASTWQRATACARQRPARRDSGGCIRSSCQVLLLLGPSPTA